MASALTVSQTLAVDLWTGQLLHLPVRAHTEQAHGCPVRVPAP